MPNPQVTERLEKGRCRKLTLISAPPGYGKSILATIWAKEYSCPVGWLSIDKKDYDLTIFLSYFVTAVQTLFPDACPKTEAILNANQTLPSDYLTSALINKTAVLPEPFVTALDDYNLIIDAQ